MRPGLASVGASADCLAGLHQALLLQTVVRAVADVARQAAAVAARAAAGVMQALVVAEAAQAIVRAEVELVLPIGRLVGAHVLALFLQRGEEDHCCCLTDLAQAEWLLPVAVVAAGWGQAAGCHLLAGQQPGLHLP